MSAQERATQSNVDPYRIADYFSKLGLVVIADSVRREKNLY